MEACGGRQYIIRAVPEVEPYTWELLLWGTHAADSVVRMVRYNFTLCRNGTCRDQWDVDVQSSGGSDLFCILGQKLTVEKAAS